ncbi:hypothetical protein [Reichenbachiella sp. MALMAid0571]|uniref:hypothetical protein n=1 Tax=Reichenbachiella sp. MALMAid0571 TaxID=3143939 RepID=UPI0032DE7557
MDNSFFLRSHSKSIEIKRFHICTWEFNNNTSLVEFGIEVKSSSLKDHDELTLELYIPWFEKGCVTKDFYDKLKSSDNSRFIFNDSVSNTSSFDGGQNTRGVIHDFSGRQKLCLIPPNITSDFEHHKILLDLELSDYRSKADAETNLYIRIGVEPKAKTISTKKKGIGKSTIIFDLKVNEERNIPNSLLTEFKSNFPCAIETCFCFHIVPNNYNITFFESEHLQNVRALEFEPFKNYLDDKRLKRDELIVIFSKKSGSESYSFFSIYTKERIGASQFAVAILINIICGFLFALPAIRNEIPSEVPMRDMINYPPIEFYLAVILALSVLLYFFYPSLSIAFRKGVNWIVSFLPIKKQ